MFEFSFLTLQVTTITWKKKHFDAAVLFLKMLAVKLLILFFALGSFGMASDQAAKPTVDCDKWEGDFTIDE